MGANKVKFTKEELKEALEPPLLKMYNCEPEAIPFRVPVDPKQLNIPDYFEIIKKPMDMSAIKNKLETGCYTDPWEFVDDVWLMFENAWIYNRKTSRVYKYCTKVSYIRSWVLRLVSKKGARPSITHRLYPVPPNVKMQ